MIEVSTDLIGKAVYELCLKANTCLDDRVYSKILNAYKSVEDEEKNRLRYILQNSQMAYEQKLPLCQDTGQVIVFLEIGQDIHFVGSYIEDVINFSIEKCYIDNFFRKSVVKNAVFGRQNTNTNTPAIIYSKIVAGNALKIKVLVKGAGSENKGAMQMMLPTSSVEDIISSCGEMILKSGENACPPMFVGIGVGGTAEKAALLSKEVFVKNDFSESELKIAEKIKEYVNSRAPETYKNTYILDVKFASVSTHIACLPVAITINCHSDRFSCCSIENGEICYEHKIPNFQNIENEEKREEIFVDDIEKMKNLKIGDELFLTGEIYVARDMAHKRLKQMIDNGEQLPFDIKNKIIFYAGPCPAKPNEVIGSVGPTTSSRMDNYAIDLYNMGLFATIGKGDRNKLVEDTINKNNARYFTLQGGVAALLARTVKTSEIVMFEDLGAEALYKLNVEKMPLRVAI